MKMRLTVKIASALALLGVLLIAGCTGAPSNSKDDRSNGFYGGVTSGGSRP